MRTETGVKKAIRRYWWEGFNGGLLVLDGILLLLCLRDLVRFEALDLSLADAVEVAWGAAVQGSSLVILLAVFFCLMLALPTLGALLSDLFQGRAQYKQMEMFCQAQGNTRKLGAYFFHYSRGNFLLHLLFSVLISTFTAIAIAMEVLSGYSRDFDGRSSYYFVSWWLVIVFLGQPVWAVYVSPILRKLVVRTADRRKAHAGEVTLEVLTEEGLGEAR
jgi:hypothetical protein